MSDNFLADKDWEEAEYRARVLAELRAATEAYRGSEGLLRGATAAGGGDGGSGARSGE